MKSSEFLVCACCCSMHSHTSMLIKLHLQKLQFVRGFLTRVVSTIAKHGDLKVAMTGVLFD